MRGELRALSALAAPLAIAYMAETAMGFTDSVIVAQLGAIHLAAIGLAANVLFGFLFVCLGFVALVGVLVAEASAARDPARAGRAARQGLWVAFVVSLPATWIGWNLAPILRFLGQDEAVVVLTEQWMQAAVWCFLPYMWFTALRHFLASVGRAKVVTFIAIGAVGVNFAANYVLVFGEFGFPRLGIAGSGYASTIVCWSMFAATLAYACLAPGLKSYRLLAAPWFDAAMYRQMIRLGFPIAGLSAAETTLFLAVALVMGIIGPAALAANQVAYSFWNFVFVLPYAIGQAVTIRVAQGVGLASRIAVRRSGYVGIAAGGCLMIMSGLVMWSIPERIVAIYLDSTDPANAETAAIAGALVSIAAVFMIVDAVQLIATGALRGLKDATVPFAVCLIGYWLVGMGGGYVMAVEFAMGAEGVWWGLASGLAATALLLTWRFKVLAARWAP